MAHRAAIAPQQNIGEGRDLRALPELARDRGAVADTAREVLNGPPAPTPTSRSPFGFALGLHPMCRAKESGRAFPRVRPLNPQSQETRRQRAMQPRGPLVAHLGRSARCDAVGDRALNPIHIPPHAFRTPDVRGSVTARPAPRTGIPLRLIP